MVVNANNGKDKIATIIAIHKQDLPLTIGLLHTKRNSVQNQIIKNLILDFRDHLNKTCQKGQIEHVIKKIAKIKNLAKQLLVEQVKTLQANQTTKSDKKDKGKGKAKVANLASRIGQVSLSERLETDKSYEERVFVSKDPKVIIPSTITPVQEDAEMVSLGDEDPYQTNSLSDEEHLYEEFRSGNCAYGADMIKYGNVSLSNTLTNKNHTVKTTVQMVHKNHQSSYHSSSVDTTTNKTVFAVQCVIKVRNESKTALEINKYNKLWIIDSGASHHITNKLSDYTSYTPYAIPEEVQTANKHDSLTILGEGTVFFDTETTKALFGSPVRLG